jgi:hypothetical protein
MKLDMILAMIPADLRKQVAVNVTEIAGGIETADTTRISNAATAALQSIVDYAVKMGITIEQVESWLADAGFDIDLGEFVGNKGPEQRN